MEVEDSKENAAKALTPFSIDNILKNDSKSERHEPAATSPVRRKTGVIALGKHLGYLCHPVIQLISSQDSFTGSPLSDNHGFVSYVLMIWLIFSV